MSEFKEKWAANKILKQSKKKAKKKLKAQGYPDMEARKAVNRALKTISKNHVDV